MIILKLYFLKYFTTIYILANIVIQHKNVYLIKSIIKMLKRFFDDISIDLNF